MKKKTYIDPHWDRESEKYDNPVPSRELIMLVLEERGKPASWERICSALEIENPDQQEALRRRLRAMVRDGQLMQNRRMNYGLVNKMDLISGEVLATKEGYGSIIPDDSSEEIYLSPRQMRTVFNGDRVLARVSEVAYRGRREGIVVEVLERKIKEVVGRFCQQGAVSFVIPSGKYINHDIIIPEGEKSNAKDGDIVTFELLPTPKMHNQNLGRILRVLGQYMDPGLEIEIAIRAYGLPHEWPESVLEEADSFSPNISEDDIKGRKDLRLLPLVTIDGADAKDFDDAVYCEKRDKGGWKLFVAIADVSHYVKAGSALDREAELRGNSVYFPERVVPMLPEILSNGLCSLVPKKDRLCMVCEMTITDKGRISTYRFYEGVMHSQARLTYNEVAKMLLSDSSQASQLKQKYAHVYPHLRELYELFQVLHQCRIERGALDFNFPETYFQFDSNKKIESVLPSIRNDAHRLIEECMLAANVSTARYLLKNKMPALFRVHPAPSESRLEDVRAFLAEFGLQLGGGSQPRPLDYAKLLKAVEQRPDARLIETVLLRSLSQAVYSAENVGHFGLAYDAYGHFTSPIRRYPDLLVHRAIKHLANHQEVHEFPYDDAAMEKLGRYCSKTERLADEATRDVSDWLKCEFMLDKLGQVFKGVITGVTGFGIFVQIDEIFVEGLVHITGLKNDYYHFDAIQHQLVGERSGQKYRLGDKITVLVARVDLDQRQIDFDLVETQ